MKLELKILRKKKNKSFYRLIINKDDKLETIINSYQEPNLYYRNQSELLAWTMSEISSKIKLDSSYDLKFEYTIFVYH